MHRAHQASSRPCLNYYPCVSESRSFSLILNVGNGRPGVPSPAEFRTHSTPPNSSHSSIGFGNLVNLLVVATLSFGLALATGAVIHSTGGMFQMRYPYSPLGEKKIFLHPEAALSGVRAPTISDCGSGSRGQLESLDMNASSATEVNRPHENDVLMGRGGKNNQHSGNEKLRQIAKVYCAQYNESSKKEKSSISRRLVEYMRDLEPPARFLKRDSITGTWVDVGDDIAREKASQVLRDAVAILLESDPGTKPRTDTKPTMNEKKVPSSLPAHPLSNWDDHHHTTNSVPMRRSMNSQSISPLPVAYSVTTTRKRSHDVGFDDSSSRRLSTLHGPILYFDDVYQNEPRSSHSVRRKSSDAVMVRHHGPVSMSSTTRYASHPLQGDAPFHGSRLHLHRRRSSATDVSTGVLLSDTHQTFSEFDLFNGQLLESDCEERAGA